MVISRRDDSAGGGGDGSGDSAGGAGGGDPFGEGPGGAGGQGGDDARGWRQRRPGRRRSVRWGGGGQGGDEEFDKSLGDFDREMGREQERSRRKAAVRPPIRVASAAERGGEGGEGGEAGGNGGNAKAAAATAAGSAGAPVRDLGPDTAAVATVAGCNDQDRVARQLCEAATEEKDPFLRAALWDEYNEYKKLSRATS